jgi:outer membrane protein
LGYEKFMRAKKTGPRFLRFVQKGLIFPVCLFLFAFPVSAAQEMDMSAAVRRGLEANPGLQAARHELTGSEFGVEASKSDFGPSVTAGYGYTGLDETPHFQRIRTGDRDNWALHLNVSQPIFTGFRLMNSYEKAKLARENRQAKLKRARLALIRNIQESFLRLLEFREKARSAEDTVKRLKEHLKVSRSFYQVGVRPRLDVLEARADVADAEQKLLSARNGERTMRARLNSLLGFAVDREIHYTGELDFVPVRLDLSDCLKEARNSRPDVRMAEKSVEIAVRDINLTASSFYPHIAAEFDYYSQGDDPGVDGSEYQDPSEWQVGVNLSWKVFEWGKTYYEYKKAREGKSRIESELEELLHQVAYEVQAAYLRVRETREQIKVARAGLSEAREGYRMARARYKAQVGTNAEVLDAQDRLSRSEANLTAAMSGYLRAAAELLAAMGREQTDILGSALIK